MQVKSNDFFFALRDICTSLQTNAISLQLLFPFIDFSMSSGFTNVMLLRKLVNRVEFFKKNVVQQLEFQRTLHEIDQKTLMFD